MEAQPKLDRFEVANRIFAEALSLGPENRAAFVRERCRFDSNIEASVLRLLAISDLGDFLERPAHAPASTPGLVEDSVLCRRFRILARVGVGGMGEVFRAEDQTLGEEVALKTIRTGLRESEPMFRRFREEIRLARRISHPNVCKTYDLFTDTEILGGPIDFCTMQFLAGETLAERIARSPLSCREALPLVAGIARGLDAAHQEGIVHRDLKPSNIILLPVADGGLRPVITDFGLARPFARTVSDTVQTMAGQIMGTLAYMAPEQFEETGTQSATDIFAFGVILFEMLTGRQPFPPESLMRTALRRVTEPPPNLTKAAPGIPPHWARTIERALSRDPDRRFRSAADMVHALSNPRGVAVLAPVVAWRPGRRSFIAGGAITATVAAVFAIFRIREWRTVLPSAPIVMLNRLTHAAKDLQEADAVEVVLRGELAQSRRLRTLSVARVEQAWRRIASATGQALPAELDPPVARDIALRSGSQLVVFGGFERVGDQRSLTMQMELMGVSPDQPRRSWMRHFDARRATDLAGIAHDAAEWLRRTIGENEHELDARNRPPEELTTPYWPALQEYVQGRESNRAGDIAAATIHFKAALRIDPDFALAAAGLGDVLRSNGQLDEALDYWRQAAEILGRRNLTDREALRIRGLFANDTGQFAEAEQIFARYTMEYPDDGLPLFYRASDLDRLGRYEEAERLHTMAIERDNEYSFIMGRASFYISRGRLDDAEKDFRTGQKLNPADWTESFRMAIAFARGDAAQVAASLQNMKAQPSPTVASRRFVLEACLYAEQGKFAAAEESFRVGMEFDRTMGQPATAHLEKQHLLAQLLLDRRPAEAVRIAEEAVGGTGDASIRMQFGAVLAQAGLIESAKRCLTPNLPAWPVYRVLTRRLEGEIAFAQKDYARAVRLFRDAVQHPHMRTWPGFLVRAALAAGDERTAHDTLSDLFFAPGTYWLGAGQNPPGYFRRAVATVLETAKWPDLTSQAKSMLKLTNQ